MSQSSHLLIRAIQLQARQVDLLCMLWLFLWLFPMNFFSQNLWHGGTQNGIPPTLDSIRSKSIFLFERTLNVEDPIFLQQSKRTIDAKAPVKYRPLSNRLPSNILHL